MGLEEGFPRALSDLERALLLWVLPEDRLGYAEYRRLIGEWVVVANGRRGEGNFILGAAGLEPDIESPLPHLFAFGLLNVGNDALTISVRERLTDQLEFEISGPTDLDMSNGLKSYPGWTLSEWLPSQPCPVCRGSLREVDMKTGSGRLLVLAICAQDRRLWVYDSRSAVNLPIPVTSFYNELMLQTTAQNRREVPDSKRLFTGLEAYSDAALAGAFESYNRLRAKIVLGEPLVVPTEVGFNWFKRATRRLLKKRIEGDRS